MMRWRVFWFNLRHTFAFDVPRMHRCGRLMRRGIDYGGGFWYCTPCDKERQSCAEKKRDQIDALVEAHNAAIDALESTNAL